MWTVSSPAADSGTIQSDLNFDYFPFEVDDVNNVTNEPIPFKVDNNTYGQVTQENTKDESFLIRELMYICDNIGCNRNVL